MQRHLTGYSHHESLNHDASDTLKAHNKYGLGAFFGSRAAAISDGVLGFNTKEETTGEAENVVDARRPVVLYLIRRQMGLFKVTVSEGY